MAVYEKTGKVVAGLVARGFDRITIETSAKGLRERFRGLGRPGRPRDKEVDERTVRALWAGYELDPPLPQKTAMADEFDGAR